MEALSSLLVPVMLAGTALFAMGRKVDVYSALADENGDLVAEYSSDGLHMVAAGYKAWADCLAGHVAYSADNPYVMGSEYYIAK